MEDALDAIKETIEDQIGALEPSDYMATLDAVIGYCQALRAAKRAEGELGTAPREE